MEKEKVENPKLSKAEVRLLELRKKLSGGKLKKSQELDEYTKIYLDMMLYQEYVGAGYQEILPPNKLY